MRIVKPYGSSQTHSNGDGALERQLHPNSFPNEPVSLQDFAETHPKLVIAQWVSCIDKIITKPESNSSPSEDQWFLRNTLGTAAWKLIVEHRLLHAPEKRMKRLEREWWSRIHPYGPDADHSAPYNFRGRWYSALAGDMKRETFNADRVAQTIYEHLYQAAYRIEPGQPKQRTGLIAARANSIARNVRGSSLPPNPLEIPWNDEDKRVYAQPGDVAQEIRQQLVELDGQREATLRRRTAALLAAHLEMLGGPAPGDERGPSARSGLMALHKGIRETYKTILEGDQGRLAKKLPNDMPALLHLVERRFLNGRINSLIRLGRVLHYSATPEGGQSHTADVLTDWPTDIERSPYWTSQGQAQIKQNEEFVRSWRGLLAMASRTLTDWADPDQLIKRDILGASEIARAISGLDPVTFDRKARLLFGRSAGIFTKLRTETKREILALALNGVRHLRNNSFHFVGLGGFLDALAGLGKDLSDTCRPPVLDLWTSDSAKRDARILDALGALKAPRLLTRPECESVLDAIRRTPVQLSDLPALRHVLNRAASSWTFDSYRLDLGKGSAASDETGRACRYFCLNLIYERGFAVWFQAIPHALLREFVDRSVTRATIAARRATQDDTVNARATGQFKITESDTASTFFSRLDAALSAEQRNTAQQDTGKFLSNLRCDVVAQALENYLIERGYRWLLSELGDRVPTDRANFTFDDLAVEQPCAPPKDWQSVLYFLLHLVPVDDVARFSHRIGRFRSGTSGPPSSFPGLEETFDLYRIMHDAKFAGHPQVLDHADLGQLLTQARLVDDDLDASELLPLLRGVREFFRFGDGGVLSPIFANVRATLEEKEAFLKSRDTVAADQRRRSELHSEWVDRRGTLPKDEIDEYRRLLGAIERHRHLSDHVTLLNHLRLHRLLVNILARLLDFSGHWERDLYFVTLALLHLRNVAPLEVFQPHGGAYPLETGQIILGLRNLQESEVAEMLRGSLSLVFRFAVPAVSGAPVRTRNELAHFNCLQRGADSINLTDLVNRTRALMAYDRKQQNTVSKSIIALLEREGLRLRWAFKDGLLCDPDLSSQKITHLKDASLAEALVGERYVRMAAALF